MKRCWRYMVGASFLLGSLSGCQTYHPETGLTLPTPHYLRHPAQYFPPSPQYPLPKETATLEAASIQQMQAQPQP